VFSHWFKDADTGAVDRFAQGFGKPEEKWAKKVVTESGHERRPKAVNVLTM